MQKRMFLVFVFLALASSAPATTFLLDRIVAVVNSEVITWSELYRAMEAEASAPVKAMSEEERRKVFKENEAAFLETIINSRLQFQEAKSHGIKVSEDELKDAIEGIKKKYSMTDAAFQESLKAEGFTYDEYKKRLQEQIILSKLVNQVIRTKIIATDADVERFMADNKEFSGVSERYRIRQIFFKKPKNGDETSVQERAEAIYKRIMEGENFSDLARQNSEDPSKGVGGDLGFIASGQLAPEFREALETMSPGEVSKPFVTSQGFHIIKLEEKAARKSAAEIREEARKALISRKFSEQYNAWMKSLREKSFIEIRL
jgi:peptidyl-prolyl cis-trans isomerase SurA